MSSTSPAAATLASELPQLEGPILIGIIFSAALGSALLTQAIYYAVVYPQDHVHHRIVMALLTLNSLLSLGNDAAVGWRVFIEVPANPALLLGRGPKNWDLVFFCPAAATALSQFFFALRAFHFSGRRIWLGGLLALLWTAHVALGLATTVLGSTSKGSARGDGSVPAGTTHVSTTGLAVAAVGDLFMTAILAWCLRRSEQRTHAGRSRSLLRRFLRMSVATGLISSCLAVVTAIVAITLSGTERWANVQVPFTFSLPHVTALCVAGTLNLRPVRGQSPTPGSSAPSSSAIPLNLKGNRSPQPDKPTAGDSLEVNFDPTSQVRSTSTAPASAHYANSLPRGWTLPSPAPSSGAPTLHVKGSQPESLRQWNVPDPPEPVQRQLASNTMETMRIRLSSSSARDAFFQEQAV